MKLAIGSDHGGYDLKEAIKPLLKERGVEVVDMGCYSKNPSDYPDYAGAVARKVFMKDVDQGIAICTTGIGISIAINKYPGIRAALCLNPRMAEMARRHNNANVLALGASQTSTQEAKAILEAWFGNEFEGGRHKRRVDKVDSSVDMLANLNTVDKADHSIGELLKKEMRRRDTILDLIASENTTSPAVREASGSLLAEKYASGYPGARQYPGCANVDEIERLARDRAAALFGAEHANVQPYSGSSANMAVFLAALEPGDTILAMSPDTGGHITHGGARNFSGKFYKTIHYRLDIDSGLIDYEQVKELAKEHKPKLICVGDSLYSRFIDFKKFRTIADSAGAYLMADIAHTAGLIAAGCYPNPTSCCEFVTFTTHKTMRGPRGGVILCQQRFAPDIDQSVFPGAQGGPDMASIAAKAVSFYEASQPEFKKYQQKVAINAKALADEMENGGLLVLSGGTDTHMMAIDVSKYTEDSAAAVAALAKSGILANNIDIKSAPEAPLSPTLRIGTAEITSRGMGVEEMKRVYEFVQKALNHIGENKKLAETARDVAEFMKDFPLN